MLSPGIDKNRARRAFNRAARTYESAAVVQREIRNVLLQRLDLVRAEPRCILEVGAATGVASRALKKRFKNARVIALDFAHAMLLEARRAQRFRKRCELICADAECLPIANASVDLIFASLVSSWCDIQVLLREFRRVMAPQGLLAMTCFGPDTMRELGTCWATADPAQMHMHAFLDMHYLGDALVAEGFASPVLDVDRYTVNYRSVDALFADLKQTGMQAALDERRRTLTGARRLATMRAAYADLSVDGQLPATVEIVVASAWAPAQDPVRRDALFSLQDLQAQLPTRKQPDSTAT